MVQMFRNSGTLGKEMVIIVNLALSLNLYVYFTCVYVCKYVCVHVCVICVYRVCVCICVSIGICVCVCHGTCV